MPKIPVREVRESGGPVLPAVRQRIPTTSDDFGGVLGRTAEQVGGQIAQVGQIASAEEEKIKRAADQKQLVDDKTTAAALYNDLNDYMSSRGNEYLALRQNEAEGVTDKATTELEQVLTAMRSGLNDQALDLFNLKADTASSVFLGGVDRHEFDQGENYKTTTHINTREKAIEQGVSGYATVGRISQSEADIITSTRELMPGADPEVVQSAIDEHVSKLYLGVLNRVMVASPDSAKLFFESNKAKFAAEDLANIERGLKTAVADGRSREAVEDVRVATSDHAEQRSLLKKALKGPELEAGLNMLNVEQSIENRHDDEQRGALYDDTYGKVSKASNLKEALSYLDQTGNLSGEITGDVTLENQETEKLRVYANSRFKAEKTVTGQVGLKKKFEAFDAIDNTNITRNQLMVELSPWLGKEDLEEVLEYHKQGGLVGDLKESKIQTIYKQLTRSDIEDQEELNAYSLYRDFVISDLKASGKAVTDAAIIDSLSRAIISTPDEGFIFKSAGKTLAQAVNDNTLDQWIASLRVPEDESVPLNKLVIIGKLEAENERRERAGEPLLRIDEQAVKRYYLVNRVGLIPTGRAPVAPIVAPTPLAAPDPVKAPVAAAQTKFLSQDEIRAGMQRLGGEIDEEQVRKIFLEQKDPLSGAAQPTAEVPPPSPPVEAPAPERFLTQEEIVENAAKAGITLSPEMAEQIFLDQPPPPATPEELETQRAIEKARSEIPTPPPKPETEKREKKVENVSVKQEEPAKEPAPAEVKIPSKEAVLPIFNKLEDLGSTGDLTPEQFLEDLFKEPGVVDENGNITLTEEEIINRFKDASFTSLKGL